MILTIPLPFDLNLHRVVLPIIHLLINFFIFLSWFVFHTKNTTFKVLKILCSWLLLIEHVRCELPEANDDLLQRFFFVFEFRKKYFKIFRKFSFSGTNPDIFNWIKKNTVFKFSTNCQALIRKRAKSTLI